MNAFQRKVGLRVLVIHVAVIAFFMVVALLKGCFRPEPKPEIITYIEIGQPGAAPEVVHDDNPDPEPPKPDPEPPKPDPEPPKPDPIPSPDPKPIPQPIPKPDPKPDPKPPKPKWEPKPINMDNVTRVKDPTPPKPRISPEDINRIGKSSTQNRTEGPVGNPNEIAAYDALIQTVLYKAWNRPAAPAMRPAKISITLSTDGRIRSVRLARSSGDSSFDATALAAARSVKTLPRKPPAGYELTKVINFEIVD